MSGSGAGSSPTLASGQTGGNPNSKTIGGKRPNGGVKSGGVRKSRSGSANPPAKSASPDDDENDDSSEEMDEKRRKFLERNRVAASKCRQKKKMWIKELERRAEDATMQNRTLHLAVAQLKEEVIILKTQLLAHRNCGCNAIQQYLQADCGDPLTHAAVASATVPLPQPMPGTIMQDPAAAAAAAVVAAAATGFPLATQPASLTQQGPPPQPRQPSMQSFVAGGNSAFIEQTHPSASPNPGGQSATSLTATPALNSSVFGKSLNDVNVP
ncbi:hypothetical protein FBU59_004000 [Linderina macrospora]|uniref:Uncharacterized protein n=1 Tax=Linderina macrospora TaxID=4868 RepID=A0ACC1J6X9_9FUNG|nr:hypothetical protein FBU59_004000 [Linderina macrospora]